MLYNREGTDWARKLDNQSQIHCWQPGNIHLPSIVDPVLCRHISPQGSRPFQLSTILSLGSGEIFLGQIWRPTSCLEADLLPRTVIVSSCMSQIVQHEILPCVSDLYHH